jgi:hypothetical protein
MKTDKIANDETLDIIPEQTKVIDRNTELLDKLPKEFIEPAGDIIEIACIPGVRATIFPTDNRGLQVANSLHLVPVKKGDGYLLNEELFFADNEGYLHQGDMRIFVERIEHFERRVQAEQAKVTSAIREMHDGKDPIFTETVKNWKTSDEE